MKYFIVLLSVSLFSSCKDDCNFNPSTTSKWNMVYEHDAKGLALSGSKVALQEAIRNGKSVRIYWAGRRV